MAEFNYNPAVKRKKNRLAGASTGVSKKNKSNEKSVEKILDRRSINGRTELLFKWKNLPMEQSTWEPAEKLGPDNIHLLSEFNYGYQRSNNKGANPPPNKLVKKKVKVKVKAKGQQQAQPAKGVTKERAQAQKAQPVNTFNPSPSSEANSSESSSSSDSTNETSSSDEEPEELQDKPPMSHMNSYNNMQSGYGMANNFMPSEAQGMTNYGLGHVRDLLSSDDDSDVEKPVVQMPTIPPNPSLEGLKKQAKSWLQMKTAMLNAKQHEPGSGASSQRRKTVHGSNAREIVNVEQQMPAPEMSRCASLERIDKNVSQPPPQPQQQQQFEQMEEPKPFETEEPPVDGDEAHFNDFGRWDESLTVPTQAYGIDMGLVLEKVLKSFKIKGETYLVAKWRNRTTPDAVKMKKLVALYPHLVIEYFEKLEMRTVD